MSAPSHPEHGVEDLCEEGTTLYRRALLEGHVSSAEALAAPCLIDTGLLQPSLTELTLLEPVDPAVAFHRMLQAAERRIADERRREARMAATFESLMRLGGRRTETADAPTITVVSGLDRIGKAIARTIAEASHEMLAIQPHVTHNAAHTPASIHLEALARDQDFLDRGGRIRTLYQHTLRHAPTVQARYEQLCGDAQARTLDEVTERLIVVDRTVAFIPASEDRRLALEIRSPAVVDYLATAFDRLWGLATPMYPDGAEQPALNGITSRQRAIARLLVEGHTDTVVANRLGMNVRTARVHIAKLATTLGSHSRTQLGYLIGQSGLLDQED